jgi:4-cresol dehydrogenase (hydroxylating) flavoprotein subunit
MLERRGRSVADMADLAAALEEWRKLLGDAHVVTDQQALREAESATFATAAGVGAILRPTREEVPEVLAVARRHGAVLHPISTGKNWGYGSRVPPRDGCVILDLGRLKAITGYDERRACITVEPGVTQGELYNFLQARGGRLWMDCTAAAPDCSIVGNYLERGFGHTPYGDHCDHVCGLELLLGDGRQFRTGFGRFPGAVAQDVYRWGLGPWLDGLFFQSNLAIVLEMTVWLMPAPECTDAFFFSLTDGSRLADLVEALRPLRLDGTVESAVHIGNDYRMLGAVQQYPWAELGGKPVDAAAMTGFARRWGFGAWTALGGLLGSRSRVHEAKRKLRAALAGLPGRLVFISDRRLALLAPLERLPGERAAKLARTHRTLELLNNLMQGVPTARFLPSAYWRKRMSPPPDCDLDRDRCGLLWCSFVAPIDGALTEKMTAAAADVLLSHGFEPGMTLTLVNERALDNVVSITYDRDEPGADERALACRAALYQRLTGEGIYPYRLDVRAHEVMPSGNPDYRSFLKDLKLMADPDGVLAPGRYDF